MKKATLFAAVLMLWVLFISVAGFAEQGVSVTDIDVKFLDGDLQISGMLPGVSVPGNLAFQTEINLLIQQEYTTKVEEAKNDSALRIVFLYKYINDGVYHSIVIKTSTSTISVIEKEEIRTFVFGTKEKLLTINDTDVLGPNGVKIINQLIEQEIARRPGVYNPDFPGIMPDQSFYVDNGSVHVVFDKYAIGPAALGTPGFGTSGFPVNIAEMDKNTFRFSRSDAHNKGPYNVRMIPLRSVAEGIGFAVEWKGSTQSIDIFRRENRDSVAARLTIGQNAYFKNRHPAVTLEYAPEIKDDLTYLPISFFERILDACYTIDQTGIIWFSYYSASTIS